MKTNDHNKQLYRDMQEEPDKYSDQEIEAMMEDLDQEPDVDEAWQQFAQRHIPPAGPTHTWRKILGQSKWLSQAAAILIGILTLSGITFAAVNIVRQSQHEEQPVAATGKPQPAKIESQALPADTIVKTGPVVFDNVTLDSIAKSIATYHHLDMDLQNEQASQLRFYFVWDQDESPQEVIEKLNMFEQVHLVIENGKLLVR